MSATVMDFHPPQYAQIPQRKPLPPAGASRVPPLVANAADQQLLGHSRTRTSSSSVFPYGGGGGGGGNGGPAAVNNAAPSPTLPSPSQQGFASRRTLSNTTTSTTSTSPSMVSAPMRQNSGLTRTSSSRSGNSPTSYVALMRKQKATVWCDRAQQEDPRSLAAQRAARVRAHQEISGGLAPNRLSSSSAVSSNMRHKIRHHGATRGGPSSLYAPANLAGSGVPLRLSATEVAGGDESDDGNYAAHHHRTGSGRSSLGSGARVGYVNAQGTRLSASSTPPSGIDVSPPADRDDDNDADDDSDDASPRGNNSNNPEDETPVPRHHHGGGGGGNYFPTVGTSKTPTGLSGGSGHSSERENSFGELGNMPPPGAAGAGGRVDEAAARKRAEAELRRRGSVDDRSMTINSGVRLFVANPDLSD